MVIPDFLYLIMDGTCGDGVNFFPPERQLVL